MLLETFNCIKAKYGSFKGKIPNGRTAGEGEKPGKYGRLTGPETTGIRREVPDSAVVQLGGGEDDWAKTDPRGPRLQVMMTLI
ncbi:hypothetical protein SKAU_G00306250 [Synaphobranchus kaupii]|uniref:Uncharacterized protein n=1 Tax=Synaphobranchus kaupii TaxID=118154 RepID=A0A9Q1EQS7_SYNKA|nr:hypothetical protein SKAU_G00306250 [Synaphobranchus kaupii]